jgi:hypothetical protein
VVERTVPDDSWQAVVNSHETSGSIKAGEFHGKLSNC